MFQALWWELQILEFWKITDFEVLKQTNKKSKYDPRENFGIERNIGMFTH